jgi:hypothetical protein
MTDYPVSFDVRRPEKFDRTQVIIRLLIIVILSILAGAFGWIMGIIYLGIPVLAAVLISQKGQERYLAEADATMTQWLRYLVAFYAYLALLTRLPNEPIRLSRVQVPTAAQRPNALLRSFSRPQRHRACAW